jgi:hypothetical protein
MDIIFEYEKNRIILPVNPEEIEVNIPSSAQKVNVIGIGQIAVPQEPDLATVTIKSFFWNYKFTDLISRYGTNLLRQAATSGLRGDSTMTDDSIKFTMLNQYVKWFEDWQKSKKPARWSIIASPLEPKQIYDFDVTCENFKHGIRAGEEQDYYYELQLIEHRAYGATELNTKRQNDKIVADAPEKSRLQGLKETLTELRVKPGETLWSITQKYGQGGYDEWKMLYNVAQNKNIIANNLRNLQGQVLQLPKEWL